MSEHAGRGPAVFFGGENYKDDWHVDSQLVRGCNNTQTQTQAQFYLCDRMEEIRARTRLKSLNCVVFQSVIRRFIIGLSHFPPSAINDGELPQT